MRFLNKVKFAFDNLFSRTEVRYARDIELNVAVSVMGQGQIEIGRRCAFGYSLAPRIGAGTILIQPRYKNSQIKIGNDVEISNGVCLISLSKITIGNGVLIADHCLFMDADFHDVDPILRKDLRRRRSSDGTVSDITIEDNVWIGSRCIILKGVTIGEGSVIGAGATVRKSVPRNSKVY